MKYLVLGSAGQIGGHLSAYLRESGESVLEFDLENSSLEDLRIANNTLLEKHVSDCDFVFFLAYDVGGSRYLMKYQDTAGFISNNMKIMANTFDLLQKYNKPFVFASSQMAYAPNSSYGSLKRLGEKVSTDLGGVVTRFWNVFGIEKDINKSHIITDLVKIGLKTNKIKVMTDGKESRQFLYADDCSRCLYEISKDYSRFSRMTLDVSSFEWTPISSVAEIIADQLNIDHVEFGDLIDSLQNFMPVDPDPNILNFWRPDTTLVEGIKKVINFEKSLLKHKD